MVLYTMECNCGRVSEHLLAPMDPEKKAPCPSCGEMLLVSKNRVWSADIPNIQGDTVAGGVNYRDYYDVGLGKYITGKRHRKYEMEKSGVVEHSPDSEMKKVTDERRYIRKHTRPNEAGAHKALHDLSKSASNTLKKRAIKRAFDKVAPPKLPDF